MAIDWQHVVRTHASLVWATIRRYIANHADAADCFQETFVKAMEVSRRQPIRHWPGLLQKIATTTALDALRKHIRERSRFVADSQSMLDRITDRGVQPVEAAQADELADWLRTHLAKLPQQQAVVLCLRAINGLSYEQIGEAMNMTANSVGVMIHRGRAKLEQLVSLDRTLSRHVEPSHSNGDLP
jgi:RNA polymerase sigma-70 factor, ECF subfamily